MAPLHIPIRDRVGPGPADGPQWHSARTTDYLRRDRWAFSPDGQWVAYQSNESKPVQIYIQPFREPGSPRQVTTAGGTQPRWRPDGKELFYVGLDGRLMAVPIEVGADRQLETGTAVPLFQTQLATGPNINSGGLGSSAQYAAARDGRFLMNLTVEPATSTPITVVLNGARC